MSTVFIFVFLGMSGYGAAMLGKILNKYAGVFGIVKAYLTCIPLCLTVSGIIDPGTYSVPVMLLGMAGSYLVALILTRQVSPIVWINMILAGFGWSCRSVLKFIGIAMPAVAANAQADVEEEAMRTQARIEEEERREAIRVRAYKTYGVRGEVAPSGQYWRKDPDHEWVNIDTFF